jgi:hypothetical protein
MHRSGTSCLAGSLQQGGLNLGKHHTWNKYNRKGNRENQDIVDLNDEILAYSGGAWDMPPVKLSWTAEHLQRARGVIDSFPCDERWGFKDPRVLLTLPMWRELLGDFARVGIFRHPLAVADSLSFRAGRCVLTEQQGLDIWYQYNRRLVAEYKRSPFPMLCFDWEEEKFHQRLNVAHSELGLKLLEDSDRFYNAELKNYNFEDLSIIPRKQRQLYKKLCDIAA